MGFLPLSEATARAVRIELASPRLKGTIGGRDFQTDLNVILTYHGAAQVATITVNIVVPNCSVDDIICLRQAVHRYKEFEFTGCEHCPDGTQYANIGALIWSYVTALVSLLDADGRDAPSIDVKGTVIEVTRIGDIQSPADAIEQCPRELYGILTCDEGWRHVPSHRVHERIDKRWATRDFVTIIPAPGSVLQLNLGASELGEAYRADQDEYWGRYYGEKLEYFHFRPTVAGLNHGSLIALETVLVMELLVRRALAESQRGPVRQPAEEAKWWRRAATGPFLRIREVRARRGMLLRAVQRLEDCSVDELNTLGRMLVDELHIDASISRVRNLLDMTENDLMLQYQSQTNAMVLLLTVLSLIVAVLGVAVAGAADWQSICDVVQAATASPVR